MRDAPSCRQERVKALASSLLYSSAHNAVYERGKRYRELCGHRRALLRTPTTAL